MTKVKLKHNSLAELIEQTMAKNAEQVAYHCLGQAITFKEIEKKSRALACYLLDVAKLSSGDRVAIQLPNINQYPIAAFAVLRAGLVLVNTNPMYTAREMQHQFCDSGAKALIILTDLLPKLSGFIKETSIETIIATSAIDMNSPQPLTVNQTENINIISLIETFKYTNNNNKLNRQEVNLNHIALIQYTGGTTGLSKGAVLTHHNLLSNIVQTSAHLSPEKSDKQELFITPLPLYHVYAFLLNLWNFSKGNSNVLIPNPSDMDNFVESLTTHQATGFCGINTLFLALCRHKNIKQVDFSKLKLTLSGGAALTTSAAQSWEALTGCTISEGYGLSETSPVVSLNPPGQEQIGTIGSALIGTEIRICNDDGATVSTGEAGEILVRGPQVMQGYWQQTEETAKVLTVDGWLKTGDIAIEQEDGFLRIVDRKKDMIIVSGFNVYPNEIENILTSHPGIVESAVIGEACEKSGELVSAFVVKHSEQNMTDNEIIAHCRTLLTAYKVPKKITFVDQLPKSGVGKVLRKNLRS